MNRVLAARPGIFDRASGWMLATLAFAVGAIVLLAAYWQTAQSLVGVWSNDGTYQYAFLIFPLVAWLIFDLRNRLRAHPPVPSVWGLAAVLALVVVWYAGRMLDVNLFQHFAFVSLFPALILAFWGWRAAWTLIFPLAYLVAFAVPWGDALVGPLQDITARIAVHALEVTGTPVLLNGREIVTPSAVWMVADACSGVKFFIACLALGCLYAYLMYRKAWKRVLFVLLAGIVPIIANGLRVYFTVLIGETWGLHYATGTDHMIFGWQFFGTVLVLLLLAGWFFRDGLEPRGVHAPGSGGNPGVRTAIWPVALALLVAGPVLAAAMAANPPIHDVDLAAPTLAGWTGARATGGGWHPVFKGASGEVRADYRSTRGANVGLFHAVYTGKPRRGHTLITYGNDLYDADTSRVLAVATRRVQLGGDAVVTARELRLAGDDDARLVWYWYCIGSRCTSSAIGAKLAQAWDVVRGASPASSICAISTPVVNGDVKDARTVLYAFARTLPDNRARGTVRTASATGSAAP